MVLRLRLRPVTVVLIRDCCTSGCDLAVVTTDAAASAVRVIERYASRWSIEALLYCDMTTGSDGDYVLPAERLVEIRGRTGPITR